MKRLTCFILLVCLLLGFSTLPAAALPAANPVLRIGIFAGANALPAANLTNQTGAGFAFGYLDAGRNFVYLGETTKTAITMTKNRNVYLNNGTYSDTANDAAQLVGSYHDDFGAFDGQAQAEAKVAELRANGTKAFVSYAEGVFRVRAASYANSGGGTKVTGSKYCVSVVVTGTNDIIFQYDGLETTWLCVKPLAPEGQKAAAQFKSTRFSSVLYYGMFEYRRFDGNNLHVYNTVEMQDYIKGVIPNEMSGSWPLEALKAQALCAKSYAVNNQSRHKSAGFDLCDNEHCQMYVGRRGVTQRSDQAVDETQGHYITYGGKVCNTFYHSSNGGATENSENVWTEALAYLRGVPDPYEDLASAYRGTWQFTYTNSSLTAFLNARGVANTGVVNFYIKKFTDMGNVYSVALVDSSGKETVYSKENARIALNAGGINTYSMRYTISGGTASLAIQSASGTANATDMSKLYAIGADGKVQALPMPADIAILSADGITGAPVQAGTTGTYVVNGRGFGHNVGMSQWGAKGMADRGYGYQDIIKHYFTGVDVTHVG